MHKKHKINILKYIQASMLNDIQHDTYKKDSVVYDLYIV